MSDTTPDTTPDTTTHTTTEPEGTTTASGTSPASSAGTTVGDNGSATQQATTDEPVSRVARLEREADVAADYLEEFLDITDLDGDLEMDVETDRAVVSIVGDDLEDLIGSRGHVLEALQELTRLAVIRETGERNRLMLDVGGFRARRRAELVALAKETVAAVRDSGEAESLPAMNPFERKVVHDAVADAGLRSDSQGTEPSRYVVVHPS